MFCEEGVSYLSTLSNQHKSSVPALPSSSMLYKGLPVDGAGENVQTRRAKSKRVDEGWTLTRIGIVSRAGGLPGHSGVEQW